jgi:hypothetical protein
MAAPVQIAQIVQPSETRFWLAIAGQRESSWSVKSHAMRMLADRRAISNRRFDQRKGKIWQEGTAALLLLSNALLCNLPRPYRFGQSRSQTDRRRAILTCEGTAHASQ